MDPAAAHAAVQVFVRLRPTPSGAPGAAFTVGPGGTSLTIAPRRNAGGVLHNAVESFPFSGLAHVFGGGATQAAVFDAVARDLVEAAALDGVSGCVLAYGQTGAGKTFTMLGDGASYAGRGLAARAISAAFAARRRDTAVRFSMLEIFEGRLIDLLAPTPDFSGLRAEMDGGAGGARAAPSAAAPPALTVAEDRTGAPFVAGLSTPAVATEGDALALLVEGSANRALAAHALNDASTRAHAVMTLYFDAPSGGRAWGRGRARGRAGRPRRRALTLSSPQAPRGCTSSTSRGRSASRKLARTARGCARRRPSTSPSLR